MHPRMLTPAHHTWQSSDRVTWHSFDCVMHVHVHVYGSGMEAEGRSDGGLSAGGSDAGGKPRQVRRLVWFVDR